MTLTVKLIVSLIIAIIAYTLSSILITGGDPMIEGIIDVPLFLAFVFATAITAIAVRDPAGATRTTGDQRGANTDLSDGVESAGRETGKVKWFNVSKGFGFIIKDDGEEIFVHFRSIRGEGRRSLRDGQRVTFVVTDSDKGPQAEDVEPDAN